MKKVKVQTLGADGRLSEPIEVEPREHETVAELCARAAASASQGEREAFYMQQDDDRMRVVVEALNYALEHYNGEILAMRFRDGGSRVAERVRYRVKRTVEFIASDDDDGNDDVEEHQE